MESDSICINFVDKDNHNSIKRNISKNELKKAKLGTVFRIKDNKYTNLDSLNRYIETATLDMKSNTICLVIIDKYSIINGEYKKERLNKYVYI